MGPHSKPAVLRKKEKEKKKQTKTTTTKKKKHGDLLKDDWQLQVNGTFILISTMSLKFTLKLFPPSHRKAITEN